MTVPREIEAKFTAPPATIERLLDARRVGIFSLTPASEGWHDDRYFDTADGLLGTVGASLRIRRSGNAAVMTFKGEGRPSGDAGNAVSRLEDEVTLSSHDLAQAGDASIDIEPPPSPLARARDIAGDVALVPVARLRTHRRVMIARSSDDAVIELAIDRCTATRIRDARKLEFVEIEAELKQGDEARLHEFTDGLVSAFPDVQPSGLTKLARALGATG